MNMYMIKYKYEYKYIYVYDSRINPTRYIKINEQIHSTFWAKSSYIGPWTAQWSKRGSRLVGDVCDLPPKGPSMKEKIKEHQLRETGDHIRLEA